MSENTANNENRREAPTMLPPVDVVEDAQGITLYADLPGVPKDKLGIQVEGDTLILEGDVLLDFPRDMQANHVEVSLPRYRRVFTLSKELDSENVGASFDRGVLTLRIPKAEHAQPRRIEIQAA